MHPAVTLARFGAPALEKSAVVKQDPETGKWILWTKDGKRKLGTHKTAEDAYKQEYAIQKSMEKSAAFGDDAWQVRCKVENEAFDRAVAAMPDGPDKEKAEKGHGTALGSCGHRIRGCRCPSGMHNIKLTLDIPCEECEGSEKSAAEMKRKTTMVESHSSHCPHCDFEFKEKTYPRWKDKGKDVEDRSAAFDTGEYDEHCPSCDGVIDQKDVNVDGPWTNHPDVKSKLESRNAAQRRRKAERDAALEKKADMGWCTPEQQEQYNAKELAEARKDPEYVAKFKDTRRGTWPEVAYAIGVLEREGQTKSASAACPCSQASDSDIYTCRCYGNPMIKSKGWEKRAKVSRTAVANAMTAAGIPRDVHFFVGAGGKATAYFGDWHPKEVWTVTNKIGRKFFSNYEEPDDSEIGRPEWATKERISSKATGKQVLDNIPHKRAEGTCCGKSWKSCSDLVCNEEDLAKHEAKTKKTVERCKSCEIAHQERRDGLLPMKQASIMSRLDLALREGHKPMTREELLERGTCCGNGCKNCPYGDLKKGASVASLLRRAINATHTQIEKLAVDCQNLANCLNKQWHGQVLLNGVSDVATQHGVVDGVSQIGVNSVYTDVVGVTATHTTKAAAVGSVGALVPHGDGRVVAETALRVPLVHQVLNGHRASFAPLVTARLHVTQDLGKSAFESLGALGAVVSFALPPAFFTKSAEVAQRLSRAHLGSASPSLVSAERSSLSALGADLNASSNERREVGRFAKSAGAVQVRASSVAGQFTTSGKCEHHFYGRVLPVTFSGFGKVHTINQVKAANSLIDPVTRSPFFAGVSGLAASIVDGERGAVVVDELVRHATTVTREFAGANVAMSKRASVCAALRRALNETHTHPTEKQISAGNYKCGTFPWKGLTIKIENPEGTTRRGVSKSGKAWSSLMKCSYGYFKGSKGKDGDPVDVFLGEDLDSDVVAIIDQEIDGKFDEHKVLVAVKSEEQARKLYLSNYEKGWKCGPITMTGVAGLKEWLKNGDTKKPFAGQQKEAAWWHRESRAAKPKDDMPEAHLGCMPRMIGHLIKVSFGSTKLVPPPAQKPKR